MDAMARDLPGEALDETIAHEPASEAVPSGPAGTDEMPNTMPQGQNRYIFGSGARPLEGYTIKRAIGRGGFGEVYYATSDAGKEVALKLITRNLDIERRGVMQCMNLKSPNLITIYDLKTTEGGDTFVIMEYVAGPSLANILAQHPKGLPMSEVRHWLKGLVDGVAYLHDHGIVHRDLKPANLFMEQGVVKIGDYGLSKLITQSGGLGHSESVGTCHYMAPEISTGKYHKPIDIYAIGVILYEMILGRVPFEGETVGEVLMKHLTARPDLSPLPEPYKTIVGKALAKDPANRPTRAYDLLPPGDAPKAPPVRFIGDKNATAPADEPLLKEDDGPDDVLRIGMEEPVFYIGPDTRPPVRRATLRERFWGAVPPRNGANPRAAAARPPAAPAPPAPRARWAGYAARRQPAATPPPVPTPLPAPPPLPSGRVRVAELATAMLWAAPLAALLSFPASGLVGIVPNEPLQLGYLFLLTLLSAWSVLIANKTWEGRAVDPATRRLVYLGIGLIVGATGLALGQWTHIPLPHVRPQGPAALMADYAGPLSHNDLLGFMSYFGLFFAANGWWKMTSRGRRSRFRVIPVVKATLLALAIGVFWPSLQPWGTSVAALCALVVQLVSPWSEATARHLRLTKARMA